MTDITDRRTVALAGPASGTPVRARCSTAPAPLGIDGVGILEFPVLAAEACTGDMSDRIPASAHRSKTAGARSGAAAAAAFQARRVS